MIIQAEYFRSNQAFKKKHKEKHRKNGIDKCQNKKGLMWLRKEIVIFHIIYFVLFFVMIAKENSKCSLLLIKYSIFCYYFNTILIKRF